MLIRILRVESSSWITLGGDLSLLKVQSC